VASVLADVLFHFSLEALGAIGLRCAPGICRHAWDRVAVWVPFGLASSCLTVTLVG
jgi:hypothetical protein